VRDPRKAQAHRPKCCGTNICRCGSYSRIVRAIGRAAKEAEILIELVATDNQPTGVGQMATPPAAPSIADAVAELAGVRLRHTPMTPDRVKQALDRGGRYRRGWAMEVHRLSATARERTR
jgi:hypothetical protein